MLVGEKLTYVVVPDGPGQETGIEVCKECLNSLIKQGVIDYYVQENN